VSREKNARKTGNIVKAGSKQEPCAKRRRDLASGLLSLARHILRGASKGLRLAAREDSERDSKPLFLDRAFAGTGTKNGHHKPGRQKGRGHQRKNRRIKRKGNSGKSEGAGGKFPKNDGRKGPDRPSGLMKTENTTTLPKNSSEKQQKHS